MNDRLVIIQHGRIGSDTKMVRAYFPADPSGYRKPVGVSASTTGNIQWAVVNCAAKGFKKLNGGEQDEIETRVKVEPHAKPNTWIAELQSKGVQV
ncbi:MAG: hypothetical protein WCH99_10245 [Verrucomicrobiota bacterium]